MALQPGGRTHQPNEDGENPVKRTKMAVLAAVFLTTGLLATACAQGNVFSLEVGQCFNDPDETDEISDVEIVDCGEPHNNEVFHLFDLAGDDYPGDAAVPDLAREGCIAAFDAYVGTPYLDSAFEVFSLFPTQESWDRGDDREVVCAIFDLTSNESTGSARNSGR